MLKFIQPVLRRYKQYRPILDWQGMTSNLHHTLSVFRSSIIRYIVSIVLATVLIIGISYMGTNASYVNVLQNGGFEDGFNRQGCGHVGNGWYCFTNGGAANYGFYDDQWGPVVADGAHSQLIEVNTKGLGAADPDRYAGIYQTVHVVDWAEYTLSMKGMIRSTVLDGDPWRYRVQVGWTAGGYADWTRVTNWMDVGWDTYYGRTAPGNFSQYATSFMAEDDYITIYIRIWKKWGVPNEEIDLNLDSIALIGPGVGGYYAAPVAQPTPTPAPVYKPIVEYKPAPAQGETVCGGHNLIYNGNFEHGFNSVAVGHVGKGWGFFTNGGAANYGFYDEQWPPVVADGVHGQLIEINTKGVIPADPDRYAGIYQRIKGLYPGHTYELTVKGMLRGAGNEIDPYRFDAQWGYNDGYNVDWQSVSNWTGMDLGPIYPRTSPGGMGTYRIRFTAPSHKMVLFLRGWKKWGISEVEMDYNLDAISLYSCKVHQVHKPHHPKPYVPKPQVGSNECTHIVKPGDSLGAIANHYWVDLNALIRANGIQNANLIYVGQKIMIPGCNATTSANTYPAQKAVVSIEPRIHRVKRGETLSGICAMYGVDHYSVVKANNIQNANLIYVGQKLVIP